MDNHESHLTISIIDIAKKRSGYFNTPTLYNAQNSTFRCLYNETAIPVTIYELASFIGVAYQKD